MVKEMESGCVLPTSTCLIQVNSAQMVGERSSHQFAHVEGKWIQTSTQLTTPPMEFLIPGCVEESLHAYQLGTSNGFGGINPQIIDEAYVDGISITFCHPRHHIWTFAATISTGNHNCPCIMNGRATPPFVGEDHFCEDRTTKTGIYFDSPLWDGQGCNNFKKCCEFNNPPWFCKQLN